jgi:SlyX protein
VNERLIEIETKLAFAEHLVDQLNEVVTAQDARILALEAKLKTLEEQVTQQGGAIDASFQKPPHY